jgi:toxic protein SymE
VNTRRLTVSYTYSDSESDKPYPFIRLQGRWLERLGFAIGSKVEVRADEGLLVLVLENTNEQ